MTECPFCDQSVPSLDWQMHVLMLHSEKLRRVWRGWRKRAGGE